MNTDLTALNNKKFSLSGFEVDAKRGQISRLDNTVPLKPKVMQVLLYLVANAPEVVTQEELFEAVWPNSIYSANSIRRCIATLRKAFDDGDKTLFRTHPKIGYSLSKSPEQINPLAKKSSRSLIIMAIAIVLSYIIIWSMFGDSNQQRQKALNILAMKPITATSSLENTIAVSSAGKLMVIARGKQAQQKLWLRDLDTGQESLLDAPAQHIKNMTFSSDNKVLYYVSEHSNAWSINQIKLNNNQQLTTNKQLHKQPNGQWISKIVFADNTLYFLARIDNKFQLFSLTTNLEAPANGLFSLITFNDEFKPYDLTIANDQLLITGLTKGGAGAIKRFSYSPNLSPTLLAHHEFSHQQRYQIAWLKAHNGFVLDNGQHLYFWQPNGALQKLNFEHNQFIRYVATTNGNQIYIISSIFDRDIYRYQPSENSLHSLIDSNGMDYFPALGKQNKLAFISTRFNKPQLFIYDTKTQSTQRQFSNPDNYLNVASPVWSRSGQSLAFAFGQFTQIASYDDNQQLINRDTTYQGEPIGWIDSALILVVIQGKQKSLIRVNPTTEETQTLGNFEDGRVFIGTGGSIYRYFNQQLFALNATKQWQLIEQFSTKPKRVIPQHKGILLQQTATQWLWWQSPSHKKIINVTAPHASDVVAIAPDGESLLVHKQTSQRDIFELALDD